MKKIFVLFIFTTLLLLACGKEENPSPETTTPTNSQNEPFSVAIGDSEIPYITIDTKGEAILNEPKVAAEMTIYENKMEIQKANIGIEFRGSTSFRISDKKSFGIETWDEAGNDINTSFFGFPEEEDWVLIGHVVSVNQNATFDRTLMHHHLGYELSRSIGRYASRSKYVELEINGEYLGVYMFMEKLKRNKERIPLKKLEPTDTDSESITGGYILKIDKTSGGDIDNIGQPLSYFENNWQDDARYNERNSFRSVYDINRQIINFPAYGQPYHSSQFLETYFLYEYPKPDIITDDQKSYIQTYINEFEQALLTDNFSTEERTYTDYIDVNSFVDFFLLNELVRNIDGYRLSTYLTKDRGEKLKMGPIWDLNIGYSNPDRLPFDDWVINYNLYVNQDAWMVPFWWPRLLEDPQFKAAIKTRWTALRAAELQTGMVLGKVTEISNYLQSNRAIERNLNKWGVQDYITGINELRDYLKNRLTWMDSEIGNF